MQVKASTPEQMRDVIVKLIDGWASNSRIKASNAVHVSLRKEQEAKANAYEGAARLIEKLEIVS